jgi:hypothetical protein
MMNINSQEQNPGNLNRAPFPPGCTITGIRTGIGNRAKNVYATLRGPNGELLISATLDYINKQIVDAGVHE